LTAPEKMQMEMGDRLAARVITINHQSVPVLKSQLNREFLSQGVHLCQDVKVRLVYLCMGANFFPGNDQHMNRCLWMDVMKSENPFILMDELGRNFPFDDFQEHIVSEHF